ncbi:DUF3352 domain-containing protein [Marivirga sp. S37H4]|uniref:DUF3352 domain-containing protein n=1 Tax=Marivirga aurantiaca TaxID=2802615 RepID=A0A934WWH9_9BACT|nr:DUF3352 domain-containing protein [Marivirga aurantiaca]MBK6264374.1 DUF3352 domain-containing protein [Marivirga aurantiaca]
MKKIIIGISILFIILISAYLYFFHFKTIKKNNPLMAVPAEASLIIQMDNPFEQWHDITNNKIWQYLKTNPYFLEMGHSIDSMNAEMKANETLWELVMGRPMVISVHQTRPNDYDFLYTIDLQRATQFDFIKNYIGELSEDIHKVFNRTYHGQEVLEFAFEDDPTTYYLSIHENLLTVSSTHTLIEQSIDQMGEPVLIRDLDFIDVSKQLDGNGIKMYVNYAPFSKFMQQWMEPGEEENPTMLDALKYSSLTMDVTDEYISISGYSTIRREQANLLTALINSGEGDVSVGTIVPDNVSYFMSLGFKEALHFYNEMEKVLAEAEDGESYLESKQKIEKFLKISIKDDFLSWIDNEIALIQLNSNSDKNKVELAVALKHQGADEAREHLDFIKQQIRKKTPVKFKGISYKGHEIHYLSIKGFFKMLFGKAFADIDKPYYTIMEDYVVFSNSPKTLGKIITAVVEKSTLDHSQEYANFMEKFNYESNLFIYLSSEELLSDAKRLLDKESWEALTPHQTYFKSFPMMGLQFTTKGKLIRHQLQTNYLNHKQISDWRALVEQSNFKEVQELDSAETSDEDIISIEDILPEDLNSKSFTEEYSNGQLKFEVSLKDGLKHGRYYQYDSAGNLLVKGRYKEDQKKGTWRYYDKTGELLRKERF